jgi:hypothetical protein
MRNYLGPKLRGGVLVSAEWHFIENKKFWKELICLLSKHYLTMLYE